MRRWVIALSGALLSLNACGDWTNLDEVACLDEGTDLDYEWASGFFSAYCNTCHEAFVSDRRGAPAAYVFDTHSQIEAVRKRIFLRSAGDNISMPPGPDDPPSDERWKLAEWIACGAPEHVESK